jgi:uncharacterized membrane protein YdjX (TVP38/TMEM64 family)
MKSNKSNGVTVVKFILLIIIFIMVTVIAVKLTPWIVELVEHPTDVRQYMVSLGWLGYCAFFALQLMHVIIAIIPGDAFYIMGGYVFGLPIGFLLSYTGVMVGSIIIFYLSRWLGADFVKMFISKEKLDSVSNILNSTKGMLGLFIICLIPVLPKDPLIYAAGLTPVKASKLFFLYAISRIPVIFMLVVVGSNAYDQNYLQMAIIVAILVILTLAGVVVKKAINKRKGISSKQVETL